MQPYSDNPFNDPHSHAPQTDGGGVGHQYTTPYETTTGFQGIPLVSPNAQGQYRNVMSQSEMSGEGAKLPTSQWDSSRYGQGSTWLAEQQKQKKRSRIVVVACIIGLVIIIAVAVSVGVVVGRKNNHHVNTANPPASTSTGVTNPAAVNQTDPNDASTFVKDPNLHQAFYGIAYTPVGSQIPECGNKLEDIIQDIQILSQITKRIRLYGADCNQTALVLEAIKRTKVDMTVYAGNFIVADDSTAYTRQRDTLKQAIQTYGADHIGGITVGNEFMLKYMTDRNLDSQDRNSPAADQGAQILIADIQDTISMLNGMSLSKHIPVGNSDAGAFFNDKVLQSVEYGMSNVHPWFANVTAETGAAWTTQFFQDNNLNIVNNFPNKPAMYIAETGWPTKSSDAGNANNGASDASVANLQVFIDTFVCQANAAGIGYFFFEFADEDWKDKEFGGVEGWWGLFNQDRTLKNIKIPDCAAP